MPARKKPTAKSSLGATTDRYITPKTFMTRVRCSKAQVSKWASSGDIATKGKFIDWESPVTKEHLRGLAKSKDKRRVPYEPEDDDDSDGSEEGSGGNAENFEGLDQLEHLTLGEIAEQHGGIPVLGPLLKAWDTFQSARKKKISSDKAETILVSRELVLQVFSHWEQANQKLLSEMPKAITSDIYAHATTGDPIHVAEAAVQKLVGEILSRAKLKVKKALAGLAEDDGAEIFAQSEDVG